MSKREAEGGLERREGMKKRYITKEEWGRRDIVHM